MNTPYFGDRFTPAEVVEKTDQDPNASVVNSDPFGDNVPVEGVIISEEPLVATVKTDESVLYQAPVSETTVDGYPVNKPDAYQAPVGETIILPASSVTDAGSPTTLLNREESEHFRARWNEIQGKFVDEPRTAVQQADTLVAEVITQITQMFTNEHNTLEGQWNQNKDVSTEDLRQALQHYRAFFNRLVI